MKIQFSCPPELFDNLPRPQLAKRAEPDWYRGMQMETPLPEGGEDLTVIFAQARESHLTLGSAQYQFSAEPGARFVRYQVTLPVKDQYGAIRRFIASVLNSVPNAALQEIHVERPAVDGNQIEARIRFALIYRTERP